MKELELKLISELMKNSRRSDRELARAIGTSQPTVTRLRTKFEKEGMIKEYTIVPDFASLGYALVVITFAKVNKDSLLPENIEKTRKEFAETFKGSLEVVMNNRGSGMGYEGVIVSFHRNYGDYASFKRWLKQMPFFEPSGIDSFLIDLTDKVHSRYLTFSYLAQHMMQNNLNPSKSLRKTG